MVDEPGGWELRRALDEYRKDVRDGFAQLNTRLDKVVTQEAFRAEQRRVEERFTDLVKDVADEREERLKAEAAEQLTRKQGDAEQQKQLDKLVNYLKWLAVSIVVPVALFVADRFYPPAGGS